MLGQLCDLVDDHPDFNCQPRLRRILEKLLEQLIPFGSQLVSSSLFRGPSHLHGNLQALEPHDRPAALRTTSLAVTTSSPLRRKLNQKRDTKRLGTQGTG